MSTFWSIQLVLLMIVNVCPYQRIFTVTNPLSHPVWNLRKFVSLNTLLMFSYNSNHKIQHQYLQASRIWTTSFCSGVSCSNLKFGSIGFLSDAYKQQCKSSMQVYFNLLIFDFYVCSFHSQKYFLLCAVSSHIPTS